MQTSPRLMAYIKKHPATLLPGVLLLIWLYQISNQPSSPPSTGPAPIEIVKISSVSKAEKSKFGVIYFCCI